MGKRKSRSSQGVVPTPISSGGGMHLGIDSAENGFVVRIDGEKEGRYFEKKFVATSPRQAFRVAAAHMPTMGKRSAGKKRAGKGKIVAGKKG